MKLLMDFHWPGNVRELENIIERAVTLVGGPDARCRGHSSRHAPPRIIAGATAALPEGMSLEQWEDEMIREALRRANGNKSQAARALGLVAQCPALSPLENRRCRSRRLGLAATPFERSLGG